MEITGPDFVECQVCGAWAALDFCAACGSAQETDK